MASRQRKPRPPIDAAKLEELAIFYVGRYATSRARLKAYLKRKLRERGWSGDSEPPLEPLAERLALLGYVDDRAYAVAKARSLTGRGYGRGRVDQALAQAGVAEEDGADARDLAAAEAYAAALRFARRKAIGPFASAKAERRDRERAIAAMVRAGHGFGLAREIVDLQPGQIPDGEEISF